MTKPPVPNSEYVSEQAWFPVYVEMLQLLNKRRVSIAIGEAIFAYGLGYARGLQQLPIMDNRAIANIHMGWQEGASIDPTDFPLATREETDQ